MRSRLNREACAPFCEGRVTAFPHHVGYGHASDECVVAVASYRRLSASEEGEVIDMFEQILVPLDTPKRGAEAIEVASHLAERFESLLILLRVEDAATSTDHLLADNLDLERRAAELRLHGLRVRHTIEFGRPEESIAELAQSTGARLIILTPHHRSLLEGIRSPSVTARLLGHIATPLLIWPEADPAKALASFLNIPCSQVIVPLDGSHLAEQALPVAVGFARMFARPLLLVRVVVPRTAAAIWPETFGPEVQFEEEAEHESLAYLTQVRKRLEAEQADLSIQSMVLLGRPEVEIKHCAETHDGSLVVMSTHGRTGIQRALLGSVATQLARDSSLPLLIVPPQALDGAAINWAADLAATAPVR
jgi:nucleotide-binding universal stress UspA family protein